MFVGNSIGLHVDLRVFWERPLDELVPGEGIPEYLSGECVEFGQIFYRLQVKVGKELGKQIRGHPKFLQVS